MRFTKMQGTGNDYLYVYGEVPENVRTLAVRLSDRHFGAGADGMIFISPSQVADFRMRMFNADGSEGKMCGNGIRCVGKYVSDKGYTDKTTLHIETLSGIKTLQLHLKEGKVDTVTVDMGSVEAGEEASLLLDEERVIFTPVFAGNTHAVIFVSDADQAPVTELGPRISCHSMFPEGTNVEFVQVISETALRMRVWERGSGVTLSCGTGACAAAAAAVRKGFCRTGEPVRVEVDGGTLAITVREDSSVTMKGPAVTVYEGEACGI